MVLPFASNPLKSRSDVERLVTDLVRPILPHFSEGRAQVRLGPNKAHYGDPAGWLEGYARPLWGLVPLLAGGGRFPEFNLWLEGLASGTNPQHPEYWGKAGDYDQRSVEQAAFGFALALAPKQVWDPLPADARERLVAWLDNINHVKLVSSNWLYFRVLVNNGLARCGQPWARDRVAQDLDQLDKFYLRDGWYLDGLDSGNHRDGRRGDYYIPMAFHFYSLIYTRIAAEPDPSRVSRYVERARHFAEDFQYYFSADGSALPFGRSLSYRFAQGAFWGGLAYASVEALPWGVIKGLYLRHLRWWMKQPIFTETGLLSIGYAYPDLYMAESYNSPGSPYWSMKAFLPLALPETHPFWKAEEEPLPRRRAVHTVPGANLILTTDRRSRETTVLTTGQTVLDWPRNAPHKYSKISYSTRFAFNVPVGPATLAEGGLDNGVALSDDNRFFRVREMCEDQVVADGAGYSRWSPWPDVELQTWVLAEVGAHLRIHKLTTKRKVWLTDAGFPLGYTEARTLEQLPKAPAGALVRTPAGASLVRPLLGERAPECATQGTNSNLLTSLTAMPLLRSAHEPGEYWLAAVVAASPASGDDFAGVEEFTVKIEGDTCFVHRKGEPWWTSAGAPAGQSSPERRAEHAALV